MTLEITETTFDDFVENNEFVLIDCWAPWCGPCRRMGPIIDELSAELEGKVAVGKLNTDEAEGISARFGITAIPTLLFFKSTTIKAPSRIALAGDCTAFQIDPSGTNSNGIGPTGSDFVRHGEVINMVFTDAHAETMPLSIMPGVWTSATRARKPWFYN